MLAKPKKSSASILTLCGISLGEDFEKWLRENRKDSSDYRAKIGDNDDFKNFLNSFFDNLTKTNLQNIDIITFPAAEIQSLFLLFETEDDFKNNQLYINRIYLYHTRDNEGYGELCAKKIKSILEEAKDTYKYKNSAIWDNDTSVVLKPYNLPDISQEVDFRAGAAELVGLLQKDVGECQQDSERIILNITGGYKAIIPFPFLFGLMEIGVETIYTYKENRKSVIRLHRLPLDWEYGFIDEYRAMFKKESPTLSKEVQEKLPPRLKALFLFDQANNQYSLNAFGQIVKTRYASKGLRRFGYGAPLLKRLGDDLQKQLTRFIEKWEYLWIGDQIPETVEHSGKHSLRLMEMANYLFDLTNISLTEQAIYILIAAFWLHDVGHAGLRCRINHEVIIDTAEFPSIVRDWHSLLSYQRIIDKNYLEDKDTSKAVALISKYHQGKMPLLKNEDDWADDIFEFNELKAPPLERILDAETLKVNGMELSKKETLIVAALLRLVDGCDVQADRVVDEIYLEERKTRTEEEIAYYLDVLDKEKVLWCLVNSKSDWSLDWDGRLEDIRQKTKVFASDYQDLNKKWTEMPKNERKILKKTSRKIQNDCLTLLYETLTDKNYSPEEKEIVKRAAGLLDRIAFKKDQQRHFIKHSGVKLVYFTKGDGGAIDVALAGEISGKTDMEDVARDIYNEYRNDEDGKVSVSDILKPAGIKIGSVFGVFEDSTTQILYPKEQIDEVCRSPGKMPED